MDGLRGLSILLVMVFHSLSHPGKGFPPIWFPFGGAAGVSLFFVISGFLITTLMLAEQGRYGRISLVNFYVRRSLRIFPPFYAFLAVLVILDWCGQVSLPKLALFASATYWMNFYNGESGSLGHTWSLSIEEQFYLIWPFLVANLSRRKCVALSFLGVLAWPLLRLVRHGYLYSPIPEEALRSTGLDTILWGSILALLAYGNAPEWLNRLARLRSTLLASLGCFLLIYSWQHQWPAQLVFLLPLLRNLSLTMLLWWSINNKESLWGGLMESTPLAFIGRLSYSLYLWHGLFVTNADQWMCRFPQNWLCSFAAALVSYRLIEQPFNRWRQKFQPGKQPLPPG